MVRRLQEEIRQSKPFTGPEQEAMLSIVRTAALLGHDLAETLKSYDVTPTQYNVLRILRGAGENGLCRNELRDRLLTQVPDATRLLDRMVEMGLVTRTRDTDDRRFVTARITRHGLDILTKLDGPVADVHRQQLGHMTERELQTLIRLLAKARERS